MLPNLFETTHTVGHTYVRVRHTLQRPPQALLTKHQTKYEELCSEYRPLRESVTVTNYDVSVLQPEF